MRSCSIAKAPAPVDFYTELAVDVLNMVFRGTTWDHELAAISGFEGRSRRVENLDFALAQAGGRRSCVRGRLAAVSRTAATHSPSSLPAVHRELIRACSTESRPRCGRSRNIAWNASAAASTRAETIGLVRCSFDDSRIRRDAHGACQLAARVAPTCRTWRGCAPSSTECIRTCSHSAGAVAPASPRPRSSRLVVRGRGDMPRPDADITVHRD